MNKLYYILLFIAVLFFIPKLSSAQQNPTGDSITIAVAPEYNKVSKLHRFFLGSHNRAAWAAPVKLRIIHLSTEKGGLKILQLGGGMQTRSLRLEDPTGQQWVLRTLQKYPDRKLPDNLKKTVAKDILQDQVSSAHPFSSLTVPPLAQALGIPHANPEVVYVADDEGLGTYRKDFANQIFLLEERAPLDADKTYNTDKVQQKIRDDNDNKVDEKLVLRARLLDMLLGDWDRHEDQWRWERTKGKNGDIYQPVPRDRDQVFYYTDGLFPWIVSHQWLSSKFQGYGDHIRDINGWNVQARYFDRYFLNRLDEDDWKKEIAYVQKTLTDELIISAVKRMPDTVYKISGDRIVANFISRRNKLMEQGLEYYRFISAYIEIPATDKHDGFTVTNNADGSLRVTVNKIKKNGSVDHSTYKRTFYPDVTMEVRLYGFDNSDRFNITGSHPSKIKLRIVAGTGTDTVTIADSLHNKGNIYVYDLKQENNVLPSRSQAKLRLSADSAVNNYDRQSFKYDRFAIITLANYGVDKGMSLIGGFSYEKHGFRKEPYAYRHEFLTEYSLARKAFVFTYTGDFIKVFGNTNLMVNLKARGPNNVNNFFGLGNESVFINRGRREIGYYRNRYDLITGDVSLYQNINNWHFSAGVAGQHYTASRDNNDRKFLGLYDEQNPDQKVFADRAYAGFITNAQLDTRNKALIPTQGIFWNTTFSGYAGVSGGHNKYLQLQSEFGFVVNPDRDSVWVIINRTGGGRIFGDAEYFQKVKLGGLATLRGFHTNRFTGETMLYNDLETRVKLFDFNSYLLPGSLGLIGFTDAGRVWSPGENSNKIHLGYGGGLYVIPARLVLIEAMMGFSREGAIPYISLGLHF
ncbi:BamA/TamA family outer membrane protein [Mucilaginibacter sp. JRF]|uniref:BamA/TamA family outer membrane protein n=1 Tax=Mucilaginibacter sp. JRF TaxID=2780088 RepID=UPI00187E38AD|nr:BamA/TamA family outer membrane protein [Mucilaginibacter sp. JRF]MBE9585204.1 BamA/TamA family outer membrane protein [Mucilaginibacter sp. JRF]